MIEALSAAKIAKPTCRAKNCRRSPWQGVGVYCDLHYSIIPYLCSFAFRRRTGWNNMSRSLVEGLDGPRILVEMANRDFEWKTSDSE